MFCHFCGFHIAGGIGNFVQSWFLLSRGNFLLDGLGILVGNTRLGKLIRTLARVVSAPACTNMSQNYATFVYISSLQHNTN